MLSVDELEHGLLFFQGFIFEALVNFVFYVVEHGVIYVETPRRNQLFELRKGILAGAVASELVLIAQRHPQLKLLRRGILILRQRLDNFILDLRLANRLIENVVRHVLEILITLAQAPNDHLLTQILIRSC